MSDPMNAVYEIMYHVVIICTSSGCQKPQGINENVDVYLTFQKESPAVEEYYFNAYVVKKDKSDTTHCERLCPAGAVAPSFNC